MRSDNKISLLIIEDEDFDVKRIKNTIKLFSGSIDIRKVVSSGADALNALSDSPEDYDLVIMDYQIAGPIRGEELIKKIKEINSVIQIIVVTKLTVNISDFNFAKGLMEAGAYWYCTKYPVDIEEYIYQPTDFLMSIFNAYEKKKLETVTLNSKQRLRKNIEEILEKKKIISVSEPMRILKEEIEKFSQTDLSILISGASGTGKELVANYIHYKSKRKYENLVAINCGSIPGELIESELFGYEKGSFTGASSSKAGLFEVADGGTIFLDEIAELPMAAQVKLLRVIQEGEIEKIGRTKKLRVNVRIIAATNKNLIAEIESGKFREDLFFRLNVIPLHILPLRERRDDIEILIRHFVEFYSLDMGRPVPEIESGSMKKFLEYDWPGNVRELKNVVQRILLRTNDRISSKDVELALMNYSIGIKKTNVFNFDALPAIAPLKDVEKKLKTDYINYVMERSNSQTEAAFKLGVAPPNLVRLLKELGFK
ncbi:MAG: sigma-54 dependent transcriptional regulator [Ignavibacteriales bacterium]|nr:sigma-54 dependent transcriptional regulator [Ignavibacteriales bacterium]MCF8307008.1 sigma-54 dependent transcriptional regulator [Ignavibacteriales bacterium]MCF8438222.1 sigma-54 dependent transcriptional regulator [Ignavibacteriales bacterium]